MNRSKSGKSKVPPPSEAWGCSDLTSYAPPNKFGGGTDAGAI